MPTVHTEVKWGADNTLDVAPVLSPEEEETLKKRIAAMDKLLADQLKAKYKIELFFSSQRSNRQAYAGALSLWESGAKLHGGGDTKVYFCPARALNLGDCNGLIPDASQGYGHLVCPSCRKVWKGSQVHGEVLARLTTQNWALLVHRYFVRLEHNADIYVKAPKHDIRRVAELEQAKQMMGEKLIGARGKRVTSIYPLKNIIKDVSAGADMLGRFRAFLSS